MKLDKIIDLAGLGLTAFIIFTLMKGFKGLADWLGGAGETIKKGIETIAETGGEIGSGAVQEITKPVPIYPTKATSKAEEFGATVTKFVTKPLPMAIAETTTEQVLKYIFKPKKTTPEPKPKKPVDITKLHKEHPAIAISTPSEKGWEMINYLKKSHIV